MARSHLSNHKLTHKENHNKFQNVQKKFYKNNSQTVQWDQRSPNESK